MQKSPGEALTAAEIRSLPVRGWAISGVLIQSQPNIDLSRMGELTDAEAANLREVLAERIAEQSVKVTFLERWDNGLTFRVHHLSGPTMKGTFDIQGI